MHCTDPTFSYKKRSRTTQTCVALCHEGRRQEHVAGGVCGWQSLGGFCPAFARPPFLVFPQLACAAVCLPHTLGITVFDVLVSAHTCCVISSRVRAVSALFCVLQKASASTRSTAEPCEFYRVLSDGKRMLSCQSPPCPSLVSALCPSSRWVFSPPRLSPSVPHEPSSPPQPRVLTNVKSLPSSA